MPRLLAACGGFLLGVLCMDLAFDLQVLAHGASAAPVAEDALASIAAYYARVTDDANPGRSLIGAVMIATLAGSLYQLLRRRSQRALHGLALLLSGVPIGLAMLRVFPNAAALGTRADSAAVQAALARSICWDHIFCFAAIAAFIAVQLRVARVHGNALRSERQAGEARAQ